MFQNSFSFDGRIRRTEYGLSFIIFAFVRTIIGLIAAGIVSNPREAGGTFLLSLVLSSPALWFFYAQGAKRCHDVGSNGWYQLIPFYVFYMIFAEGDKEDNEYGSNPKL